METLLYSCKLKVCNHF